MLTFLRKDGDAADEANSAVEWLTLVRRTRKKFAYKQTKNK